jgi:hypothetical protein
VEKRKICSLEEIEPLRPLSKQIFEEMCMKVWNGVNWLRIGFRRGL